MEHRRAGEATVVACLLLLLFVGLLYPLLQVLRVAFVEAGWPTARPLLAFLARPLYREALLNTLLAGLLVVAIGSVIAVPLALLTVRYRFPGRDLLGVLGVLPLVIPPFVGAVSFQQTLGPSGALALLLREHAGVTAPAVQGLAGVVLVQSLHYFPVILLGTAAALGGLDRSLEEAARNLGCSGLRLLRRVVLPLILPGYLAGALLTFIRVIDDLGTPLVLGYANLLAPQAYVRVTTAGLTDVDGSVICAILLALSLGALWLSRVVLARGGPGSLAGGEEARPVPLGPRGVLLAWLLAALLLGPALLPQLAVPLLSVSTAWSGSWWPAGFTGSHYEEILIRSPRFVANTLRYALLAAAVDVALGGAVAWLRRRGRVRGRRWLDTIATIPLAVPGVVIAVGSLHAWSGLHLPGPGDPLTATGGILVVVYAVRRLPHAVSGADAALAPLTPALEEAARNLGATRSRTLLRITVPLVTRGLLAGGLLVFIGSVADLSATLLLVPRVELAPLSYGFYLDMQSPAGRGPAAALGVVAILLVAAATWAATALARGSAVGRLREPV